ncbi:hypothetical protein BCR59_27410 [Klebsiella pneumoniae]|nr:hypothetical protein BCR59_27410 [Klebsiella pneumoniae]
MPALFDQIIKFIGVQLRQRALKSANNASKVSISPALKGNAIARAPSAFNPCNHLVHVDAIQRIEFRFPWR